MHLSSSVQLSAWPQIRRILQGEEKSPGGTQHFAVRFLRKRFGITKSLLSDTDMHSTSFEDCFTQSFSGSRRVALGWPDDALDEDGSRYEVEPILR